MININTIEMVLIGLIIFFLAILVLAKSYQKRQRASLSTQQAVPVEPQLERTPPTEQPSRIFGAIGFLLVIGVIGIITLAVYWLVFPSPDEVYTASDLQKKCSGSCFISGNSLTLYNYGTTQIGKSDFSMIEIYFAEIPKTGDVIDVQVGLYKARTKIGGCYYTQNTLCYIGEWWYIDDPNNPIGATSGGIGEVWYVYQTMVSPLNIKKGLLQSPAIWIGDNYIASLLRSEVMTPKPMEGEITISCSNCKIKEVRIHYNLLAKFKNKLIGWI